MSSNSQLIEDIIQNTQPHGVVVDTNILLLLLIGLIDKNLISTFKRLNTFIEEDFETLERFLSNYQNVFTTPTILAEVSNLSNSLYGKYQKKLYLILKKFTNQHAKEIYKNINTYNSSKSFQKFGVTDSNITKVAKDGPLVLTDDFPLAQHLRSRSLSVLNFNNIRIYGW